MRTLLFVLALIGSLAFAGAATAQNSQTGPVADYVMETANIEGTLIGPDGEIYGRLPPRPMPSLLRIRTTFVPEVYKSAENL
jgi:hypothetical protein